MNTSDYLESNRILASKLIGQKIQHITRFRNLEPEDEIRMELGPILLSIDNGLKICITVDEGMGNILLFDASVPTLPINDNLNEYPYKLTIFPESNGAETFISSLSQPIFNIETISRTNEDFDFFSMCGLKLSFTDVESIYIGVYLTEDKIPSVSILKQDELDKNLCYQTLNL
jgi:hypothetical protein